MYNNYHLRNCLLFIFFIAISFLLPLFTKAQVNEYPHKAIVKIYTYYEDQDYYLTPVQTGSGVIINSEGAILTNHHVITVNDNFDNEVPAAFKVCLTVDTKQKPNCYYSAYVAAKDKDRDLAILRIKNVAVASQFSYEYLNRNLSYKDGDVVQALGYPGAGGDTITSSYGTITGTIEKKSYSWMKTSALVSFGSSGGALLDLKGNLLGITTAINPDLGFAIAMSSIENWINSNINNIPTVSPIQNKMNHLIKEQYDLSPVNTTKYQNPLPHIELQKPQGWEFDRKSENYISIKNTQVTDGGFLFIIWNRGSILADKTLFASVKVVELSQSCILIGNITLASKNGYKMTCPIAGQEVFTVYLPSKNYIIAVSYYYGKDNKDKKAIDNILNNLIITDANNNFVEQRSYEYKDPYFKINLPQTWALQTLNLKEQPLAGEKSSIPEIGFNIQIEKQLESLIDISNEAYFNFIKDGESIKTGNKSKFKLKAVRYHLSTNHKINNELNNEIFYKYRFKDENDNDKVRYYAAGFRIRDKDKVIIVEFYYLGESEELFEKYLKDFQNEVLFNLTLGRPVQVVKPSEEPTQPSEQIKTETKVQEEIKPKTPISVTPLVDSEEKLVKNIDQKLINKLKGHILLQVQEHGEAWYIDPISLKKYYMKDGATAYGALRKFGLGIKNVNLNKIPIGVEARFTDKDSDGDGLADKLEEGLKTDPSKADTDGDGMTDGFEVLKNNSNPLGAGKLVYDQNLVNKYKGKLLLQVESRGEAWYVNPKDGKRYYLKDGDTAYQIMRFLSLGIANESLRKIPIGRLENQ